MKTFGLALAALAALALSACYPPTTTHPVGTTVGLKSDPALIGTWKSGPDPDRKPGEFYYYHFLTNKDGILVVMVPSTGGEASDVIAADITTAQFGKFGVMNATLVPPPDSDDKEPMPHSVPILYRTDAEGRITLYLPDEDATKDAIKAGKIAGDPGKSGTDDAVITADGPALDKFIASKEGQALYTKPFAVLTKLN
ncbi:MAG TPA: hypothetical protein VMJ73_13660 [Rhizomicrobium sp.]|nr:hypothetical protein [Rhizomicrobium sp.]